MNPRWRVGLAEAASRDFVHILRWTAEHFGMGQARTYDKTLRDALQALASGPDIVGIRRREDIGPGILSLHVARKRRKGRHFILFRANVETRTIEVLRLLHDSMDLAHHLPPKT